MGATAGRGSGLTAGDRFQTIVDPDATPADAEPLARRDVEWLTAEGVVLDARTRCVPGPSLGYPPGPHRGGP